MFLVFVIVGVGCKKQIKPKKNEQTIYRPCDVIDYGGADDNISKCCPRPYKPSGPSQPVFIHENSLILKPKRFELLCKEIKNFDAKKELIGKNDSVVYNINKYKEAFLAALRKTRHKKSFRDLQKLLCNYKGYRISFNENLNSPNYRAFYLFSCFGEFECIIQNKKIVSANEKCLVGETVPQIFYGFDDLQLDTTVAKLPHVRINFNSLQGETYKITGGGIIWVNGKINAEKYTKNGESLFKVQEL